MSGGYIRLSVAHAFFPTTTIPMPEFNEWLYELIGDFLIEEHDGLLLEKTARFVYVNIPVTQIDASKCEDMVLKLNRNLHNGWWFSLDAFHIKDGR